MNPTDKHNQMTNNVKIKEYRWNWCIKVFSCILSNIIVNTKILLEATTQVKLNVIERSQNPSKWIKIPIPICPKKHKISKYDLTLSIAKELSHCLRRKLIDDESRLNQQFIQLKYMSDEQKKKIDNWKCFAKRLKAQDLQLCKNKMKKTSSNKTNININKVNRKSNNQQTSKRSLKRKKPGRNSSGNYKRFPLRRPRAIVHASKQPIWVPPDNYLCNDYIRMTWLLKYHNYYGNGIYNLGNTCFMNSVLQCLAHSPQFYCYLVEYHRNRKCHSSNTFCFLRDTKAVIESIMTSTDDEPLTPFDMASNVDLIDDHLQFGKQQDAQEFLNSLIDKINGCEIHDRQRIAKTDAHEQTTGMYQIFGSHLLSEWRCDTCNNKQPKFEPITSIIVSINGSSLNDCLDFFFQSEKISGENANTCSRCKVKRDGTRTLAIHGPPTVFIISIKRFNNRSRKIDTDVSFQMELDLSKYVTNFGDQNGNQDQKNVSKYRLFGVVVHSGNTLKHGHYYALAKNPSNRWTKYSDNKCKNVYSDDVLTEKAYILFYSTNTEKDLFEYDIQRAIHLNDLDIEKCVTCKSNQNLSACARCSARKLCEKCKSKSIFCKVCQKFFDCVPLCSAQR